MAALARAWHRLTHNDQLVLAALALVVGTAAGYGSIAFRGLAGLIQERYGKTRDEANRAIDDWLAQQRV